MFRLTFICIIFLLNAIHGELIVSTRLGLIKGTEMTSSKGRLFAAFRSIPYAKPPVGELRFRDPVAKENWEGILDGTKESPECIQYDSVFFHDHRGVEDCLYLNIYTHELNSTHLRPVMVWIHGGAWYMGNGNGETGFYGPKFLLDQDIILVTLNYRLGPFGFLSTEDNEAPGNYGLLDQTLALKWIQDHIDRFGGDPNSVTIFGESAGGGSVHHHVLSPRSRGLFHRAIAQSGTANCPWAILDTVGKYTTMLAEHLSCPTISSELIQCLRQKKVEDIVNFRRHSEQLSLYPIAFGPRIDTERQFPFIPRQPEDSLSTGQFNQVPFIAGMTENESGFVIAGLLNRNGEGLEKFANDPVQYIPYFLGLELHKDRAKIAQRVLDHYFKLKIPYGQQYSAIEQTVADYTMFRCIKKSIDLMAKHSQQPNYLYWYTHRGTLNMQKLFRIPSDYDLGVSHGDELFLLFSNEMFPSVTSQEDKRMSRILTDLWTSFAAKGKPSSDLFNNWLPITEEETRYLNLNAHPVLFNTSLPFERRLAIWDEILKDISLRDEL